MSDQDLGFAHVFVPAAEKQSVTTLVLLHGTGGDEHDLLAVGRLLAPGYGLLGVRGKVREGGAARYFRRIAEGIFDEADLRFRTVELADFLAAACERYELAPSGLLAVGYSNGANIAASMLLLRPDALAGAVLLRAMLPLVPEELPDLHSKPVLLQAGQADPIVPQARIEQLADVLTKANAEVDLQWNRADHALTASELDHTREWMRKRRFV